MAETALTVAQKTNLGLMTTGIGLMVVFAALFLIIIVTMILSHFVMEKPKKQQNENKMPEIPTIEHEIKIQKPAEDANLIAVLTAAITAYFSAENSGKLIVRSYRKVTGENLWSSAGRNSKINNRF